MAGLEVDALAPAEPMLNVDQEGLCIALVCEVLGQLRRTGILPPPAVVPP